MEDLKVKALFAFTSKTEAPRGARRKNNSNLSFLKLLTLLLTHGKLLFVHMEVYPSLAEGIGLENRQGCQNPRGFESLYLLHNFNLAHKFRD